jgi:hypothetical protein
MPAARKKLGILTFHKCINFGSYWQARCLAEGLRARGIGRHVRLAGSFLHEQFRLERPVQERPCLR